MLDKSSDWMSFMVEMKVGDLIKVKEVQSGVHPVGLVISVHHPEHNPSWAMVFYQDGDLEPLDLDVEVEIFNRKEREA